MTTTNPTSQPTRTDRVTPAVSRPPRVSWLGLLIAAGCATIASFVIAMIMAGSVEGLTSAGAATSRVALTVRATSASSAMKPLSQRDDEANEAPVVLRGQR